MTTPTYATECLWCGQALHQGICQNIDCLEGYPQGDSRHCHWDEKTLCLDPYCTDNRNLQVEVQYACAYCGYTADSLGICDDDDCPTHWSEFTPAEPGTSENGDWLVQDGLLNPDGTPTPLGQECWDWVAQRLPDNPVPQLIS